MTLKFRASGIFIKSNRSMGSRVAEPCFNPGFWSSSCENVGRLLKPVSLSFSSLKQLRIRILPHTDNVWKVLSKGCLLGLWFFLWTKQSLLRSSKVMNNNGTSRILKGVKNWTSTGQRFCWVVMLQSQRSLKMIFLLPYPGFLSLSLFYMDPFSFTWSL